MLLTGRQPSLRGYLFVIPTAPILYCLLFLHAAAINGQVFCRGIHRYLSLAGLGCMIIVTKQVTSGLNHCLPEKWYKQDCTAFLIIISRRLALEMLLWSNLTNHKCCRLCDRSIQSEPRHDRRWEILIPWSAKKSLRNRRNMYLRNVICCAVSNDSWSNTRSSYCLTTQEWTTNLHDRVLLSWLVLRKTMNVCPHMAPWLYFKVVILNGLLR